MAHSQLILDLDSDSLHEAAWVVVSKSGEPSPVTRGSLKQAAKQAHGHKVTLLVHASDVLLSEVNLPAMNKQRLVRAVPFAMEENLAADLDSLHFAIGERYESGELGIAVCSKEQIHVWLNQLKIAGLYPDYITSDVYGVPFTEDAWTLHMHDTSALAEVALRVDEQAGMGIEVQNTATILKIMLEKLEPEQRPKSLSIIVHEQSGQNTPNSVTQVRGLEDFEGFDDNEDSTLDLTLNTERDLDDESPFSFPGDPSLNPSLNPSLSSSLSSAELSDELSANDSRLLGADDVTLNVSKDTILPSRIDVEPDEEFNTEAVDVIETSDDTLPDVASANSEDEYYIDDTGVISSIKDVCGHMQVDCTVEMSSVERLSYLAQNYSVDDSINVLQGEFSRKEQLEKLFKPWIPAAAIGSIWMFLQLGLFVADYQRLSGMEQALRQQVVTIYKQAFPEAKNIVDPKRQMEAAIKKLKKNQGNSGGFLSLVHQAGGVLKDTPAMTIKSIRFKSDKLDIDMEIADLQSLDELKSRLLGVGTIEVEIVSAGQKDGKVDSRIQIKPKA